MDSVESGPQRAEAGGQRGLRDAPWHLATSGVLGFDHSGSLFADGFVPEHSAVRRDQDFLGPAPWTMQATDKDVTIETPRMKIVVSRADGSILYNDATGKKLFKDSTGR